MRGWGERRSVILSVRFGSARLGSNVSFVAGGMEAYIGAREKWRWSYRVKLRGGTSRKRRPRTRSMPIS